MKRGQELADVCCERQKHRHKVMKRTRREKNWNLVFLGRTVKDKDSIPERHDQEMKESTTHWQNRTEQKSTDIDQDGVDRGT